MNKRFDQKTEKIIFIFIIFFSFLVQLILIPRLSSKYFYDSNSILNYVNGIVGEYDQSYIFVGNFFKIINFFSFTTFRQWSFLITLICTLLTVKYLFQFEKVELHKILFLYATIALCNIYVFRISKEFVQLLFWALIYIIYKLKINDKIKCILSAAILIIEGLLFRKYFIIIGIIFACLYYVLKRFKKLSLLKILVLMAIGIIVALYLLKFIKPNLYDKIVNLRITLNQNRENSMDAITVINDIFLTTNPIFYCINYFFNLVRMLFPVELILKGIKYLPFVVYQVYISIYSFWLYKKAKKTDDLDKIYLLSIMWGYWLVSVLFEPDFGSFIRHETTLYIIFLFLFFHDNLKKRKIEDNLKK